MRFYSEGVASMKKYRNPYPPGTAPAESQPILMETVPLYTPQTPLDGDGVRPPIGNDWVPPYEDVKQK